MRLWRGGGGGCGRGIKEVVGGLWCGDVVVGGRGCAGGEEVLVRERLLRGWGGGWWGGKAVEGEGELVE